MTDDQWAGLMLGDEAYTGSKNFYHFVERIENLTIGPILTQNCLSFGRRLRHSLKAVCPRRTFHHDNLDLFRVHRRGAEPAALWESHQRFERAQPPLVLRELQTIRGQRRRAAHRPAHVAVARCAAPAVCQQRRHGPVGGPAWRVLGRETRRTGLSPPRRKGLGGRTHARDRDPRPYWANWLPHSHRWPWPRGVRLAPLSRFRRQALEGEIAGLRWLQPNDL